MSIFNKNEKSLLAEEILSLIYKYNDPYNRTINGKDLLNDIKDRAEQLAILVSREELHKEAYEMETSWDY